MTGAAEEEGAEGPVLAEVDLGVVDGLGDVIARAREGGPIYTPDSAIAEHLPVRAEAFRNCFVSQETEPVEEPPPDDISEDPALQ